MRYVRYIGRWIRWFTMSVEGRTLLVIFAALVGLGYLVERADSRRCAEIMALARSTRDSLDAKIACERIRSATATNIAIGVAAGTAAAAAASRR